MGSSRGILRWFVWGLACLFLFYEYFLRTGPSVIVAELALTFQVTAAAIGTLSGLYFWIYAPMQIPVGMLMDRYGARRLLTLATTTCGIGSLLFGMAGSYWLAAVGRILMGLGSSFAFVGMVYVSSHWFRGTLLALLIGLGNSSASLGAVVGEGPLAAAVHFFGWRGSLLVVGIIGLVLAIAMFFVMRREMPPRPKNKQKELEAGMWANLVLVSRNPQSWINALVAMLAYATTSAFAGLWGVPFLTNTHNVTAVQAGFAVSMIFVGWIFGGPIVGYISDRMRHRRIVLRICLAVAFVVLLPVIYLPDLASWVIFTLLFLVGFFSSGQLLNFSLAIEINPHRAKGTATAFTNFLIAIAGAVVQPLVGVFLDALAPSATTATGLPIYTARDFRIALSLFPAMMLLAFLGSFWIKPRPETKSHAG